MVLPAVVLLVVVVQVAVPVVLVVAVQAQPDKAIMVELGYIQQVIRMQVAVAVLAQLGNLLIIRHPIGIPEQVAMEPLVRSLDPLCITVAVAVVLLIIVHTFSI
jgi:hypothetical protein